MSSLPSSPTAPCAATPSATGSGSCAAAGELFAERGLSVTLDDIARHAGVGVGTVYRRFPDKELLIDALFEERLEAMCAIAEEALADPDPWDGLVQFFERGCELPGARPRPQGAARVAARHGGGCVADARERLASLVDRALRPREGGGRRARRRRPRSTRR